MSGPSAKIILQPSRNSKPSSNTLRIKPALPTDHGEKNRGFGSALHFALTVRLLRVTTYRTLSLL
jgi:hypothetical protein